MGFAVANFTTADYVPYRTYKVAKTATAQESRDRGTAIAVPRHLSRTPPHLPQYTLFRLDSLFSVNFSSRIHLTTVGDELHPSVLSPFEERKHNTKQYFPWSGSAIARFEPSTRDEHAGYRMLHLRIVKIIEPVIFTVEGYNGRMLKPEGKLLTVSFRGGVPEPWTYGIDIEGKCSVGLRALWDL
ncbi:hypothetical protein C8R44DRAFT_261875 [Mycena epipterygia]|nr:hypothetical protein C8R44DRAFT_261875 [Mycena epipterygia]